MDAEDDPKEVERLIAIFNDAPVFHQEGPKSEATDSASKKVFQSEFFLLPQIVRIKEKKLKNGKNILA